MTEKRFRQLLEGYLRESLTSAELRAFLHALHQKGSAEVLLQHLESRIGQPQAQQDPTQTQASLETFMARLEQQPARVTDTQPASHRYGWLRNSLRYAAAVVALATGLLVILTRRGRLSEKTKAPLIASVLAPADRQAQFRPDDRTIIVLDRHAVQDQVLDSQGVKFIADSNELVYGAGDLGRQSAGPQELATGRGYQIKVVLPDGTKVWLNAKSSLRYDPVQQTGTKTVVLEGEGYFEVTPNASNPFVVKTYMASVAVIGTSFNVRAYRQDSTLNTGIYDGSVQVSDEHKKTIIKSGEQLTIYSDGTWSKGGAEALQAAIGWKDQLFYFRRATITAIMAELSRWYNIDYEIEPGISRTFSGKIPRTEDLSTVLEVLKEGGITYRKSGHKLVFFR